MKLPACLASRFLALGLSLIAGAATLTAQVSLLVSAPAEPRTDGQLRVWLVALNHGPQPVDFEFAPVIEAQVTAKSWMATVIFTNAMTASRSTNLPAGGFAQHEYRATLTEPSFGPLEVAFGASRVVLPARDDAGIAAGPTVVAPPAPGGVATMPGEAAPAANPHEESSVLRFFKAHFDPYEPMYFIAGFDEPNAKFQFSLRYRIFNEDGLVAQKLPVLANVHFAYTQTSLWDWEAESAPFKDSSYRPELHYAWRDLFKTARDGRAFRLDLEGGIQHESNGRDGLDSRSLNIAYARPRVTFGRPGDFQVSLAVRAWAYLGEAQGRHDALNNPLGEGLKHYRGYVDFLATAGCDDGLMLSAYTRVGDSFQRANLTLDATYPLSEIPIPGFQRLFAGYLHVQYFTGWGESLIDYDLRSDTVRFGFSLWR